MTTYATPDTRAAYTCPYVASSSGKYKLSPSRIVGKRLERNKAVSAPTMLWLDGAIYDGWRLNRPILLKIERDEDGEYIASDSFSTVYGNGKTCEKATADYRVSLVEYYELVAKHANDNLPTAILLHKLRKYISQVP